MHFSHFLTCFQSVCFHDLVKFKMLQIDWPPAAPDSPILRWREMVKKTKIKGLKKGASVKRSETIDELLAVATYSTWGFEDGSDPRVKPPMIPMSSAYSAYDACRHPLWQDVGDLDAAEPGATSLLTLSAGCSRILPVTSLILKGCKEHLRSPITIITFPCKRKMIRSC